MSFTAVVDYLARIRRLQQKYTLPLSKIPAGVVDDQTLVIRIGETDVKMFVRVEDSEIFTRDGSDIGSHVTISIAQAVLGGSRKVDRCDVGEDDPYIFCRRRNKFRRRL